jgi:ABC-type sugar transport system permease subunit
MAIKDCLSESGSMLTRVANELENEVTIVDIQMPFMSMVVFMVKWVIASIPAVIVLGIIFAIFSAIFVGIFGGMGNF